MKSESLSPASAECRAAYRAVRGTLDVVSGKWKLAILATLLHENQRFKELSHQLRISPRVLAKELVELEQHQLITRTVRDTRPVTVEYAATAHVRTNTIIGSWVPVTGADTRTCKSTPRPGAASTTGLTETTGTGPLAAGAAAWNGE